MGVSGSHPAAQSAQKKKDQTPVVASRSSPPRKAKDKSFVRICTLQPELAAVAMSVDPSNSPQLSNSTGENVADDDEEDDAKKDDKDYDDAEDYHLDDDADDESILVPQLPPIDALTTNFEHNDDELLSDDEEDDLPPDSEVSTYTFFAQLNHYMEGAKIGNQNRKAVEISILVEAGTCVRNMDAMKKTQREDKLFSKYVSIINEIEDDCFEDDSVRADMLQRYKGAKAALSGANLLRKLDAEMRDIRKFAAKFPGFNNPAELPSGIVGA
jgi:hypothetical protein